MFTSYAKAPYYPSPWAGSPGTIFVGEAASGYDAGAVRIDNIRAMDVITITALVVSLPGAVNAEWDTEYWGGFLPLTLSPGRRAVFTQCATCSNVTK